MDGYALFYLVGALRDGSVYRYSRNYYVIWYSSNKDYLERVIVSKLRILGFHNVRVYQYKRGAYRVRISSKQLFHILVNQFEHPLSTSSRKTPWPTPQRVKDGPLALQIEYVKGFVDAEGSVIKSSKGVQVDVSQQIMEPLKFLAQVLEKVGVKVTGIYLGSDGVWRLRIASLASLRRFAHYIGFRHPCKSKKLNELLGRPLPGPSKLKGIGGGAPQGVEPAA
ncbi:homing endonuclease I-ApeI [Aeropyrum pernix K1]|uniref:Homing endonuclease I-ApeI n=1 Tax=Aeropyrum pernix (strain ATCC 700893 / DSM 11879 / JCM 9820 / NBRC 100138 / K1) TaxID=272557 RepID=APE1_AERPE|nr:RecName: Full=Homing endonuclease I-ApeI; AltName: Full=rRNA intron-encoded homing endonuclease 1 [Aeropyrum pernix K1]BAA31987.2 rRNA intron-encoded homing endonuclease [Aeropyrum pernix]BAA80936.2 homing endonuclease I-ApeI [Aeropyrum pernix K1]